jgi:hypothetical protein
VPGYLPLNSSCQTFRQTFRAIAGANLCVFGYFRHVLEVVTKVMSVVSKGVERSDRLIGQM